MLAEPSWQHDPAKWCPRVDLCCKNHRPTARLNAIFPTAMRLWPRAIPNSASDDVSTWIDERSSIQDSLLGVGLRTEPSSSVDIGDGPTSPMSSFKRTSPVWQHAHALQQRARRNRQNVISASGTASRPAVHIIRTTLTTQKATCVSNTRFCLNLRVLSVLATSNR
jgi:hypothetical protein